MRAASARVVVAGLVTLVALTGACTKMKPATSGGGNAGGEASYFYDNRDRLKDAPPDLAGALQVSLGTFSQPAGRKVNPGEPSLTLGLSVTYVGQGPELVCLDTIPWKAGDIEKGPGARLTKTKRYGFSLKPGEKASIDIPVVVDRVGPPPTSPTNVGLPGGAETGAPQPGAPQPGAPQPGAPSTGAPQPGAPSTGAPTTAPSAPSGTGLGTGTLAAGRMSAQEPSSSSSPAPVPNPSPLVTPRPAGTPTGPTIPQKGGPLDPSSGVQVILVCAYTGANVPADAYKTVTLVPPDRFGAVYGPYTVIRQGIPVPLDQLL